MDQAKRDLTAKITENLMQAFNEVDPGAAKKMKKFVKKSVGPLAQKFLAKAKTKPKARENPRGSLAEESI